MSLKIGESFTNFIEFENYKDCFNIEKEINILSKFPQIQKIDKNLEKFITSHEFNRQDQEFITILSEIENIQKNSEKEFTSINKKLDNNFVRIFLRELLSIDELEMIKSSEALKDENYEEFEEILPNY